MFGVVFNLKNKWIIQLFDGKKYVIEKFGKLRVYCFLLFFLFIGLLVYVNGYFVLDYEVC